VIAVRLFACVFFVQQHWAARVPCRGAGRAELLCSYYSTSQPGVQLYKVVTINIIHHIVGSKALIVGTCRLSAGHRCRK
jgi:hypothetical protein